MERRKLTYEQGQPTCQCSAFCNDPAEFVAPYRDGQWTLVCRSHAETWSEGSDVTVDLYPIARCPGTPYEEGAAAGFPCPICSGTMVVICTNPGEEYARCVECAKSVELDVTIVTRPEKQL